MALPSSGQLTFDQINVALGNSSGSEASLRAMSAAAGFSTPDQVSDFYSFSSILLTWGSIFSYLTGAYRVVNHTGQDSSQTITINFNYNITSSVLNRIYTSINSTSSWTTRVIFTADVPKSGSFSVTGIGYSDVVRVRILTAGVDDPVGYISFNGGTVTSGSGTVTGTSSWLLGV